MTQEMRVLGLAVASAGPYANNTHNRVCYNTNTCLTALFPGLPRWAGTRKIKPIRILLKQMRVSGSGINWAICKSANCSRQTTLHHSVFLQAGCPSCRPTNSVKALKANGCATKCTKIHFSAWVCPGPPLGSYDTIPDLIADWRGGYPLPSCYCIRRLCVRCSFFKYDHLATLHAYGLHKYFKQVLWIHSTMLTKHVIKHLQFWVSEYTVQNCKIPSVYSEFASWNMCRESLFPVISILQRQ